MLQVALHELGSSLKSATFSVETYCFDKQIEAIRHPAKFKTWSNSRRSGKTEGAGADMLDEGDKSPNTPCLYLALSRLNAKIILWDKILKMNDDNELGYIPNHTDLILKNGKGSSVMLGGIANESEIRKWLGGFYKKIYIDECQAFPEYLRKLIFDILMPTLWDMDGSITLLGVPNARKMGVFYDACHNNEGFANWVNFHWNVFDNPYIEKKSGKCPKDLIEEELRISGLNWNHPTIRRNVFGEWVEDDTALVYAFNPERNVYKELPENLELTYVLGLDFGFEDADAAVLWGYSPKTKNLYLIEDGQKKKQTISELAAWIKDFQNRFPILKIVGDTGGLGKKIVEEIYQRHGILVQAADKARKREFIELMNSDFRTGVIKVPLECGTVTDWRMLEWDTSKFPYKEDVRLHPYTHRPDAGLYGYREARHWMYEEPKAKVIVTPQEQVDGYWDGLGTWMKEKDKEAWWEKGY